MTRTKAVPVKKKPSDLIKKNMKKEKQAKDRKKRRYRSGTRALKEVRKAQKGNNKGFDVAPLSKLVRQIAKDTSFSGKSNVRFGKQAILALKQAGEDYVTYFMKMAQVCTIQGDRQTVKQKDCKLASAFMHGMHYLQQPNGTERMFRGILCEPRTEQYKTAAAEAPNIADDVSDKSEVFSDAEDPEQQEI
jgi:histone H3/H4